MKHFMEDGDRNGWFCNNLKHQAARTQTNREQQETYVSQHKRTICIMEISNPISMNKV